jgi:hypothetical protein
MLLLLLLLMLMVLLLITVFSMAYAMRLRYEGGRSGGGTDKKFPPFSRYISMA